jgi:uncharacterized protein YjbI with pentapeptide repeats
MSSGDASAMVKQGAKAWNAWRERNPGGLTFSQPDWYDARDSRGRRIKGRNRYDFSGMNLSDVSIYGAFAEGLNLSGSVFDHAHFEEGDFARANFGGATFRNTKFNKTILTGASFDGATFVNCNLNRINLTGASFAVQEITETVVYGVSAWDVHIPDATRQSRLVIERTYDLYSDIVASGKVPMMVDDLELAQFIYYLSNHRKLRDTLNVLNAKGVLLLGRFQNGGLERLHVIREFLAGEGYLPMVFDFARPDGMSLTETVITMAGLSKFIVADLSGASVPAELQGIFTGLRKPLLALGKPYAMFRDVDDLTNIVEVSDVDITAANVAALVQANLSKLDELHARRIMVLARRDQRNRE